MNLLGELGRPWLLGSPLKSSQIFMISSTSAFFSNDAKTAAVWPSVTGTLRHCEVIFGVFEGMIFPSVILPQILSGYISDFSSSPFMKGIILSFISGQELKFLPAPEIAWYVQTKTDLRPNFSSG